MKRRTLCRVAAVVALFVSLHGVNARSANVHGQVPGYPEGVTEASYPSDGDGSMQPTLVWFPESERAVPLLVALHTWSSDYRQPGGETQYARWCQKAGWAFIHPNFRGVNKTSEAMGSDLAVADIRSAVAYAKSQADIDPKRVYCVGVSGGGHASLLMAAREPEIWAGVSAWCGISDIAAWHAQCKGTKFDRYSNMIESALGGAPDQSEQLYQAAMHRSPLTWLKTAQSLPPLDINHGINDGRDGSVPFTQSIHAWNAAVPDPQRIPEPDIVRFYESREPLGTIRPEPASGNEESISVGSSNVAAEMPDQLYGDRQPVFRKVHGTARLTIFDGGHEIVHEAALNWLAAQVKGEPVEWSPARLNDFSATDADRESGK